jgi:hypothetical protein
MHETCATPLQSLHHLVLIARGRAELKSRGTAADGSDHGGNLDIHLLNHQLGC